jgi:hypothetical protein
MAHPITELLLFDRRRMLTATASLFWNAVQPPPVRLRPPPRGALRCRRWRRWARPALRLACPCASTASPARPRAPRPAAASLPPLQRASHSARATTRLQRRAARHNSHARSRADTPILAGVRCLLPSISSVLTTAMASQCLASLLPIDARVELCQGCSIGSANDI